MTSPMTGGLHDDGDDPTMLAKEACVGSMCFLQPHPLYLPPPFYGNLLGPVSTTVSPFLSISEILQGLLGILNFRIYSLKAISSNPS